jgi:16S rRNA (cytidine1402-2'-O)-methyltransferase
MKAGLYITATPIGNLRDITLRALETLKEVDAVICEDTRVTEKLLSHYGLKKTLLVYNDHSSASDRQDIISRIEEGEALALVSDAGTPLISDPGYKLVRELQKKGLYITTLPGASSVVSALTISGLATDSFLFIGFLPQKEEGKRKEFKKYKNLDTTLVMFERGSRLNETLAVAREVFGDIECAITREISKLYEEVITDTLSNALAKISAKELKGEIVLLLSNKPDENNQISESDLNEKLTNLLYNNSVKDAANIASELYGISRKEAYEKLLKLKK